MSNLLCLLTGDVQIFAHFTEAWQLERQFFRHLGEASPEGFFNAPERPAVLTREVILSGRAVFQPWSGMERVHGTNGTGFGATDPVSLTFATTASVRSRGLSGEIAARKSSLEQNDTS